jgi:hypothetical protein
VCWCGTALSPLPPLTLCWQLIRYLPTSISASSQHTHVHKQKANLPCCSTRRQKRWKHYFICMNMYITALMCTNIKRKKHWSISLQFPCLRYCTGSRDLILLCSSHRHKLRSWNKFHKCVLMKERNNVLSLGLVKYFFFVLQYCKQYQRNWTILPSYYVFWRAADFTKVILFQVLYSCLRSPISFLQLGVFKILQFASTKTQHIFHITKPQTWTCIFVSCDITVPCMSVEV